MNDKKNTPLAYSCSGCSSAAQMANYLALRLDRQGIAEMSCIAGVGGDVKSLVATAKSGRPILAIDGCPLKCALNCLKRHNVTPSTHIVLSDYKVSKKYHEDFNSDEANHLLEDIIGKVKKMKTGNE